MSKPTPPNTGGSNSSGSTSSAATSSAATFTKKSISSASSVADSPAAKKVGGVFKFALGPSILLCGLMLRLLTNMITEPLKASQAHIFETLFQYKIQKNPVVEAFDNALDAFSQRLINFGVEGLGDPMEWVLNNVESQFTQKYSPEGEGSDYLSNLQYQKDAEEFSHALERVDKDMIENDIEVDDLDLSKPFYEPVPTPSPSNSSANPLSPSHTNSQNNGGGTT